MSAIQTLMIEQLPRATGVTPEALTAVQEPGGPMQSLPIKALLGRLIATNTAKETLAELNADLAHHAPAIALVYADPVAAQNGWYRKSGASGAGAWHQFEKLAAHAVAEVQALIGQAASAAARFSPFKVPPATDSALFPLVDLDIWRSARLADGRVVPIILPAEYGVREFARQAGLNRIRFRLAGHNGGVYTDLARESTGAGALFIIDDSVGFKRFPLYAHGNALPGIPPDTQIGWWSAILPAGAIGAYTMPIDYAVGGLHPDRVQPSTEGLDARVSSGVLAERALIGRHVFAPWAADTYLRTIFEDFTVENGDPESRRDYYISLFEAVLIGGTLWRVRVHLADRRLGRDVAQWVQLHSSAVNPFGPGGHFETNFPVFPLTQGALPDHFGVFATARVRWRNVVAQAELNYSGPEVSGIDPSRVVTPRAMRSFLTRPEPAERIFFGGGLSPTVPNAEGVIGYPTLQAAVQSVYIPGTTPGYSDFPNSYRCSFGNQIEFQAYTQNHVEDIVGEFVLPPYAIVRGLGMASTRLRAAANSITGLPRVTENTWPVWFEDIALEQLGEGYIDHRDNVGFYGRPATAGPRIQRWAFSRVFKRVWLITHNASIWGVGSGFGSDEENIFEDCLFDRRVAGNGAMIGCHDSPQDRTTRGCRVWLINCRDISHPGATTSFASLATFPKAGVEHQLIVRGGQLRDLSLAANWRLVGDAR